MIKSKYKKSDRTSTKKSDKERIIVIDFETKSMADLPLVGAGAYSEPSTTEIIVLGFKFLKEKKIYFWKPGEKLPLILKNHKGPIIAHNYKFEYHIIKNVMPKLPAHWYDLKNYRCTAATALRCGLPQKLATLSQLLKLKTPKLKDIGNELINKFSKPKTDKKTGKQYHTTIEPKDFEKFCLYNKYDLLATEEIYNLLPKLHEDEFENPIFELDKIMSYKGIQIDSTNVNKLIKAYESYQERAYKKAKKLCGLTKSNKLIINSSIEFKKWLNDRLVQNVQVKNVQAFTLSQLHKTIDTMLIKYSRPKVLQQKYKNVKEALKLRKILSGKAEKKLYRLKNMQMKNKFIPDIMQYYGAHTGRGAGRGIQPHNFYRGSSKQFVSDVSELCKNKTKLFDTPLKFKNLLRQLLIAGKGNKFLIGDFKAIEAKITFWLAGCNKGLELYKKNLDPYIDMASRIYKTGYENINKKQRELGKKSILGLGYGMGHKKFKIMCYEEDIILTKIFSQKIVNLYRNTYPKIRKLWYDIESSFKSALQNKNEVYFYFSTYMQINFLYSGNSIKVILPSGRIMYYFLPHMGLDSEGREVIKYTSNKGFIETIWGGGLIENLVQSIARDLMFLAMLESSKNKLMFPVFTVHDEIINICKTKDAKKALTSFKKIMCNLPDWAQGLPPGAECVVSDRYRKI